MGKKGDFIGMTTAKEPIKIDPRQTSIPGLTQTDETNGVVVQEETTPESTTTPVGPEQPKPSAEKKQRQPKRTWGELVLLHGTRDPNKGDELNFSLVDDIPDTNSAPELEQWLSKSIEESDLPTGIYMIARRVKIMDIKTVRRIEVSEVKL